MLKSASIMLLVVGCSGDPTQGPAAITAPHLSSAWDDTEWTTPANLGPVVNSAFSDFDPVVSKDGLSLYFTAGNQRGGFGQRDLWVARRERESDPWGTPVNLGSVINTPAHESKPSLSADGHRLYFASNRPDGLGQFDIYVSFRQHIHDEFDWEPPINLGSVINSAGNEESGVTFFEDEATGAVTMFFASQRSGGVGGNDIYSSLMQPDGSFGPVELVAELSTPANDVDPSVRKDGRELFLASSRVGTNGANDIWVSRRASTQEQWSTPENLRDLNTPPLDPALEQANDNRPWLSFDGSTLYFCSAFRDGNTGFMFDIWMSTRSRK